MSITPTGKELKPGLSFYRRSLSVQDFSTFEKDSEKNPKENHRLSNRVSMLLPKNIFGALIRKDSTAAPMTFNCNNPNGDSSWFLENPKANRNDSYEAAQGLKQLYHQCTFLNMELDCFFESRNVLERFIKLWEEKGSTIEVEKVKKQTYATKIDEWIDTRNLYELFKDHVQIEDTTEKRLYEMDIERGAKIRKAIDDLQLQEPLKLETFIKKGYDLNRLTRISSLFFTFFSESGLKHLDLSENRIVSFEGSLMFFPSLEHLELQKNEVIREIPPGVCHCTKLNYVDLSENSIEKIPEQLSDLKELTVLFLSQNKISSFATNNMANLKNLQRLDLSHNALLSLPEEIGSLSSLENFDVSFNGLEMLPSSFRELKKLRELKVNNNKLKSFPEEEMKELEGLTHLFCSNNELNELPSFPFKCLNIEMIDLAHSCSDSNKKRLLAPFDGKKLTHLQTLILSQNKIKLLPPNLGDLSFLTRLDVSCNLLSSLPDSLSSCNFLQELDFSKNELKKPPKISSKISYVNSDENPFMKNLVSSKKKEESHHRVTLDVDIPLNIQSCPPSPQKKKTISCLENAEDPLVDKEEKTPPKPILASIPI